MEVYYGKTKRPIVFGVGGVICHGNDIFCKILVSDLPGVILLGSSSNLVWRCVMISRRRVLVYWCGRSHRCHGNPIFGGNLLVSTLATSSSPIVFKFGMEVRYGKSKTPIGFWCGRSHCCHGNPIFCGNFLVSTLVLLRSSSNLAWRCVMISRRHVLVFGVGGVIVAMVTPFLAKICL